MNREQLDEIRARASAAQSGRWICVVADDSDEPTTAIGVYNQSEEWYVFEDSDVSVKDADFIACARQDIPALLDEIDRRDPVIAAALAWRRTMDLIGKRHPLDALAVAQEAASGLVAALDAYAATTAEGSAEGGTSKGSKGSSGGGPTGEENPA